eukprot:TRINITY_DN357_c0_g2_i1.p1 TRINITY_DN357_c0_g2~~TRINITY_DN357_c0_g2_i1.p1  ORF type:complete len:444 (+),score=193.33 TRINITY_DN357_c0_g2_i1:49-1380(+)
MARREINSILIGLLILFILSLIKVTNAQTEDWAYVDVRPGAHMFWWLYTVTPSTEKNKAYYEYPLVIWLQGGPGASSTGYGNFEEIGPLDVNLQPRNSTWLQLANLLFIDNPVGTGYSYVDNYTLFTRNNDEIATDLVTGLKSFLASHPEFVKTPLWIFSESYGGKMTSGFGVRLYEEIKKGNIDCNFKGVELGDSWVGPIYSVLSWADFLYQVSEVDNIGRDAIQKSANLVLDALNNGKYVEATQLWGQTETVVEVQTFNVDFYNFLNRGSTSSAKNIARTYEEVVAKHLARMGAKPGSSDPLSDLMNGPIRDKLGIIPNGVTWGGQSGQVFQFLSHDFMIDSIGSVDKLLDYGVEVNVVTGQLDVICATPGTLAWVNQLQWSDFGKWNNTEKTVLVADSKIAGFIKSYKNLNFYWILAAGHMIPSDQPAAALRMLDLIINY